MEEWDYFITIIATHLLLPFKLFTPNTAGNCGDSKTNPVVCGTPMIHNVSPS